MLDKYGRKIDYIRISITDNCNLNCIYCTPGEECNINTVDNYLSPNDYKLIAEEIAKLGFRKVRITGGEPLVRNDVIEIIKNISSVSGIEDISITTNGILLSKMAKQLKEAGLVRVNVSLDSLQKDRFAKITGGGRLENVLGGVQKALDVGLKPVKINVVTIKDINDEEIFDLFQIAKDNEVDVRFIELMPIGSFGENNKDKIVKNDFIINSHPELIPCLETEESLPARYYRIDGYRGRIGFISPMSHKFCTSCNRIRLTYDGKLKPCLGSNGEVDLLQVLRQTPQELGETIIAAIYKKPQGHNFEDNFNSLRNMSAIGG